MSAAGAVVYFRPYNTNRFFHPDSTQVTFNEKQHCWVLENSLFSCSVFCKKCLVFTVTCKQWSSVTSLTFSGRVHTKCSKIPYKVSGKTWLEARSRWAPTKNCSPFSRDKSWHPTLELSGLFVAVTGCSTLFGVNIQCQNFSQFHLLGDTWSSSSSLLVMWTWP